MTDSKDLLYQLDWLFNTVILWHDSQYLILSDLWTWLHSLTHSLAWLSDWLTDGQTDKTSWPNQLTGYKQQCKWPDWLNGRLVYLSDRFDQQTDLTVAGWLTDWLTIIMDQLAKWLVWLTSMADWLTDQLTKWLVWLTSAADWLTDQLTKWLVLMINLYGLAWLTNLTGMVPGETNLLKIHVVWSDQLLTW